MHPNEFWDSEKENSAIRSAISIIDMMVQEIEETNKRGTPWTNQLFQQITSTMNRRPMTLLSQRYGQMVPSVLILKAVNEWIRWMGKAPGSEPTNAMRAQSHLPWRSDPSLLNSPFLSYEGPFWANLIPYQNPLRSFAFKKSKISECGTLSLSFSITCNLSIRSS